MRKPIKLWKPVEKSSWLLAWTSVRDLRGDLQWREIRRAGFQSAALKRQD